MLALVNGSVLFPDGRLERADIYVEGKSIKEIRVAEPVERGTETVDLAGRYVIPGLINLHSHLTFFKGAVSASDQLVALNSVANAWRALKAGITTVRDVGGIRHADIRLRDAIATGLVSGPRLLVAGQFICMTGGHSNYYAREADGEEIRRAVREQVRAGADLIKFMGSGGVAAAGENPDQVQFTFEELRLGIDEAHRLGRKVAVHAHPTAAIRNAVLAGADYVEHASYLDEETIELLLDRDVIIVPTLSVYQRIANDESRPPALRENARRILNEKLKGFARAAHAGVRWGVGLDNGTFYPPDDIASELELLVAAGIPSEEVLLAATTGNAQHLGLDRETGSIAAGQQADLVVLDGNPLADVAAVRDPWLVLKEGNLYPNDPLFQADLSIERNVV